MSRLTGRPLEELVAEADRAALVVRWWRAAAAKCGRDCPRADGPGCEVHISVSTVSAGQRRVARGHRHRPQHVDAGAAREPVEGRIPRHARARTAQSARRHRRGGRGAEARRHRRRDARGRGVIERQVRHMARLLDDLLDLGRVVTGKISLERRMTDLAETVRSCVSALTPAYPHGPRGRSRRRVRLGLRRCGAARADRRQPRVQRAEVHAARRTASPSRCGRMARGSWCRSRMKAAGSVRSRCRTSSICSCRPTPVSIDRAAASASA